MGIRGYHTTKKPATISRPPMVALVAAVGMLASIALFGLAIALLYLRTTQGLPLGDQALDIGITAAITLFLLRIFWGIWDLLPSSWWSHMIIGPILILALIGLISFAPEAAKIVAHDMPRSMIAQAELIIRSAAIGLAVIEGVTILVLIGARQAFAIGAKKQPWERVKH
jgi:hypothetical protein